jgi:hypothetical protein
VVNKQASAYVARGDDVDAATVFDHPGLRVAAASPRHLLAMKVLAARRRDSEDIRVLVGTLDLDSVEQVLDVCSQVFPDEEVPARVRLILEDIFGADHAS